MEDIRRWVRTELWDQVPVRIAVIDRDFKIVEANRSFAKTYGEWRELPCYAVYKDRSERCERCAAASTFADSRVRVREEMGVVIDGTQTFYLVRTVPLVRQDGTIPYIIEMSTDITETKMLEREKLERVAKQVMEEEGINVPAIFGTMIETPRAALTAGEIAEYADFFSFGTNDLTQMSYGFSRDDAEGKFLLQYVDRGILPDNPFQTLDQVGVGRLIEICVADGKSAKDQLEVGICGEHGGDPRSIQFCHEVGLNYVSCSPFRVPVARLAAAHASLRV